MPIDHSRFSREDIESVLAGIDRDRYPETYRAALAALETYPPSSTVPYSTPATAPPRARWPWALK